MFSTVGNSHKRTPPINGSFALDHEGECRDQVLNYLNCLREQKKTSEKACRSLMRAYFECRLRHQLITEADWHILGLGELPPFKSASTNQVE